MESLDTFKEKLNQRLLAAERFMDEQQQMLAKEMDRLADRHEEFAEIAQLCIEEIIQPRVQHVVESFDNGRVEPSEGTFLVKSVFRHTPRYPATTELLLGVSHDESVTEITLYYDLKILPVFMDYPRHGQKSWALHDFDQTAGAVWVEERLINFFETYLRLSEVDQYQQENLCTDPVCGMRINKSRAAAQADLNGKSYYFCVDSCHDAFIRDPGRYVKC